NFVEERLAGNKPRFAAVVDSIRSLFAGFVAVAPKRSGAVHSVFIDGVEVNVERAELLLVVLIVSRDASHGFETRVDGCFSLTHHFNNRVSAADFDVFLAFAGRARRTHLLVYIAARTDNRGISHASGYFPRKPGSRCGCRNITFSV